MAKAKTSETKNTESKLTLAQTLDKINFSNKQTNDISDLQKENAKLKDMIINQQKSKRGPSSAGRISGLRTLSPRLGQQFQ